MKILVTGGAGYLGSHTILALLQRHCQVSVIDDFSNASPESLKRVEQIAGRSCELFVGDLRDTALLDQVFADGPYDAVIHFAGFKAVGESVAQPLEYYDNNLLGAVRLCQAMQASGTHHLIFSSTAALYDPQALPPHAESTTLAPANPYGRSKWMIEQMLQDFAVSYPALRVACLRYFNPIGAHPSGLIGESPASVPNNVLPYLTKVAVGELDYLTVHGDDWPTPDGSGVRDYIHVMDLVEGHLAALDWLVIQAASGFEVFNLGAGRGFSVFELIRQFEQVTGVAVSYRVGPRRSGDVASSWADVTKANRILGWQCGRSLDQMLLDAWNWQRQNPQGYLVAPMLCIQQSAEFKACW
jgi:UDP-glucose 4-epimerase